MRLIDMHCDTLTYLMNHPECGDLMDNSRSVDLRRLKGHGRGLEFFACFVYMGAFEQVDDAYQYVCRALDFFDENKKRYKDDCVVIKTADDVRRYFGQKEGADRTDAATEVPERALAGALLTVEEGGILNGRMERLETLYERGVRLITLTWNFDNCLGHPNSSDPEKNSLGLTEFGFEVIRRMEEMGMLVDVSHLSDGGFFDVARTLKKPFVASHSNARAICPHPRNLTDEMLKVLAEHGGAAGLNFCPAFLDEKNGSTIDAMKAHIRHMIQVAGEDVVAIGTDFDGIDGPLEISHTGELMKLWDALEADGVPGRILDKLWYGNAARVMQDVLA